MITLMKHYIEALLLVQTITQPIQHRAVWIIQKQYRKMKHHIIFGEIQCYIHVLTKVILQIQWIPIESYIPYFLTIGLNDPTVPITAIDESAWNTVNDICIHASISYEDFYEWIRFRHEYSIDYSIID